MTKAEELINKHLDKLNANNIIGKDGNIYKGFLNAINEAINYTRCCTELPTSTQLLSDCKKRFKELEGEVKYDYRSYKNGYLDSFSKNVVSKINKHQCNCSNTKDKLDCGFECYNK